MASDKQINIGVGADISGLKTGMDSAAKTVQDAGKKMESAAKEATVKTESSFANLRQAYRATAKDAYEIALQQGTNSAAFIEATTRAGQFKDELDQVNATINAFSSDTPILTASLGVGQGLAGAFSAAQGAMALFGGESEKLQETMVKVQASLALVQGLTALGGLRDSFLALSAVITTRVVPAIASIGVTLSATGIGLAVVAIGALAMAYKELSDKSDKVAESTRLAEKAQRDYNASVYDYLATDQQKAVREENMRYLALKKLAEDRKKLLDDEYKDLNKVTFGAANKAREESYQKTLKDIENIEKQHQENIKEIRNKYAPKITKGVDSTKDSTIKSKFSDLKNQIKFVPTIDTSAIEDLTGLMDDAGSQLAESLDGAFSPIDFTIADMQQKISDFATEVEKTLIQGAANAFAQFGQMVGESMAGANANFEQAGMAMIASLASTIGSGMIALGIPMLFSALTAGEGAALIAGGTALNVLAGSLNAGSQKKISPTSGGGGGGFSSNNGFSGFTPTDNTFSINSRLIGTDLLLSVQKSSKKMDRIR